MNEKTIQIVNNNVLFQSIISINNNHNLGITGIEISSNYSIILEENKIDITCYFLEEKIEFTINDGRVVWTELERLVITATNEMLTE